MEVGRSMKVLIVENDPNRGRVWRSHIVRLGALVAVVAGQSEAVDALSGDSFDIVILNLDLGAYMSNACALIPAAMPPEDMAALVEHHGR